MIRLFSILAALTFVVSGLNLPPEYGPAIVECAEPTDLFKADGKQGAVNLHFRELLYSAFRHLKLLETDVTDIERRLSELEKGRENKVKAAPASFAAHEAAAARPKLFQRAALRMLLSAKARRATGDEKAALNKVLNDRELFDDVLNGVSDEFAQSAEGLGDGKFLAWLTEHWDEILALIMKIIPLFIEDGNHAYYPYEDWINCPQIELVSHSRLVEDCGCGDNVQSSGGGHLHHRHAGPVRRLLEHRPRIVGRVLSVPFRFLRR